MTEMTRSFNAAPSTLDRENRTVEVVALSGLAPAVRPAPAPDGTRSRWVEELDASSADLSRLSGAPVLLDHSNRVDAAVGSVAAVRREGDKLIASIKFDQSARAEELIGKIESGSVRGVSLGYSLKKMQRAGFRDGLPVFRAVDWTASEISFTPLPVDPGATVRSKGFEMSETAAVADGNNTVVVANDGGMNRAAINGEIRSIARAAGLSSGWADQHIDAETGIDAVRAAALDELKTRSANSNVRTSIQVGVSHDDPTHMVRSMADALACRLNPSVKPEGRAAEYVGMNLLDMAGELAAVRGEKLSRNRTVAADELFKRSAHSTSDFPLLLESAVNKSVLPRYAAAEVTYKKWAAQRSFNDFRPQKFMRLGDFPSLKEIGAEGGEPTFGTISENREQVTAVQLGSGISISRKALINDDLGELQGFAGLIGQTVAADENRLAYEKLTANPALSDGTALFHADHGNLAATGAAITVNTIGDAIKALRLMTSLDGLKLNIQPKLLVVGPAYEQVARQYLAAIQANQSSNVNPWSGSLEIIVDANISGNAWYVFADPNAVPSFIFGYVAGSTGPVTRTEIDFQTRAFKIAVGLDFGVGAIDFRGAYKNAGA